MSTPSLVPTLPGRRYADPAVLAGFHDWVREMVSGAAAPISER
jgi:hypothetical protein